MKFLNRFLPLLIAALMIPATAGAQPAEPRTLAVPAGATWQHAATGMMLPAEAAGLTRTAIRDSGAEELDVDAAYQTADGAVTATVYVFRTGLPDASLWFDRAVAAIYARPEFGLSGEAPRPVVFARPGATTASGLRTAIDVGRPNLRSTALAMAPLGSWLVKVRLSAAELDAATLDARLTRFVEAMRWPAPAAGERAAAAIEPCPSPLRLRRARIVQGDVANLLMDLVAASVAPEEGEDQGPPPIYCREPGANVDHGVYRPDRSTESYVIALGDAGIALSIGRASLDALLGGGGGRRYSMMLLGRNSTSALPSFNRLPPPSQALSVAFGSPPSLSVTSER